MREPADARSRLTPELGILRSTTIIPALDLQGGAVEVRFVLPPGWSAVTPWPSGGRGFRIPSTRLEAVEYLGVGPFRRDSVALDGTMVQIAAAGPLGGLGPADVRSVLEMLESLAGPLADTLDARTVLVVPWKFMRGGAAGFASAVHAPSPLLLVYELFHWWNHANVTAGEGAWFREGVTNYFGILVARRLDLATEEETLACLADLAAEMRWLEASRPTSLADASAAYGTDARARRLVYSKGTLFARLLDQPDEEEAAAVGRLARRVFEERRRDRRPLTHARLEMLFDEVLGAPGARLFARHVSGARPLPDPGLPAASGTSGCARFLPPDEARGEESDSRLRRQVSGRP